MTESKPQIKYPTREVLIRKTRVILPRRVDMNELEALILQIHEVIELSSGLEEPLEVLNSKIEIEAGDGELVVTYSIREEDDLHAANHGCGDLGATLDGLFLRCTLAAGHIGDHKDESHPAITWRQ